MDYPEELIRGIPNKDDMAEDYPDSSLFKRFDVPEEKRDDEYSELSVNWYDDEGALKHILSQKKDSGELQFKAGAAILIRSEIDALCKRPAVKNQLTYERKGIDGNNYHGNLLLKNSATRKERNLIASGIALCVSRVEI